MSHSTLSGRLPATNLDENNVVKFESRKYPSYDSLMKDLELWRTINFVQLTRRNCPLLKPHEIIEAEVGREEAEGRALLLLLGFLLLEVELQEIKSKAVYVAMILIIHQANGQVVVRVVEVEKVN